MAQHRQSTPKPSSRSSRRRIRFGGAVATLCVSATSLISTHNVIAAHATSGPFTVKTALTRNVPLNTIPIVGDFYTQDGNLGIDDIIWYGFGSIADRFWRGLPSQSFSGFSMPAIGGSFEPITGDFDGDTNLDIFWYAKGSASDYLWYGHGDGSFTSKAASISGTYRPLVADFDGDGRTDILWYAPGTGGDTFWYGRAGQNGVFSSVASTINGYYDYVTGGELTSVGALDLIWWKATSTVHPVWHRGSSNARSYTGGSVTGPDKGSLPMVMYINSDKIEDIFWYGDGSLRDAVALGPTFSQTPKSISGSYQPLWGNFDGDNAGYDDVFWWAVKGGGTDSFWRGDGSINPPGVSMSTTPHYDWDSHSPLLGFFDGDESLDVIFQDPFSLTSNAFLYGIDLDGVNPGKPLSKSSARSVHARSNIRGGVCGTRPIEALRMQCSALR